MSEIFLSVIIPAYNEEQRLGPSLKEVAAFLEKQPFSSELLIVDDGSQDETVRIAEESLHGLLRAKILRNDVNRGKGFCVKKGMLEAKGDYLFFTDADLSTPIEEISAFLEDFKKGYDVIIGSRSTQGSNVEVHQPIHREGMGKIFNLLARIFAFSNIHDSQCGFKGFKQGAAKDLFTLQKLEGFSFDAEIIYLAQKRGYKILEKPVTWRDSPNSRVSIVTDPLKMILDLIRIRWLHRS